jgi:type I restriction enzyme S subunit
MMERYEKYKDSGVEWIGEIPGGWKVKKFKYLYDLVTEKNELDLPKIGLENIGSKTGEFVVSNTDFEGEGNHFKINDILFGKLRPYLAKVYLAEFEGKAVGDFYVFRCKNKMDAKYSSNLILSKLFIDLTNSSTFGSKMPRVAWDIIANFEIPYPNLTEQTIIANYLDRKTAEIDQLIAQKERLLYLYEEEKTAIINQAVTQGINSDVKLKDSGIDWLGEISEHWEVKKLKYVGEFINGYSFSSSDFISTGVRVLKISNIQHMKIDWSDTSYIDESFYEDLPSYRVHANDLVFALTRPIISTGIKAALIDTGEKILINQRNSIFRTKTVETKWIFYMLLSRQFINEFDKRIDKTGQQPNISSNDIGDINIPVPSPDELATIVQHIETKTARINAKIDKTKKIIALQKEYRTALISEVVTGKIKVTQEAAS